MNLDQGTRLTKYGYPCGKTGHGSIDRLYVCDASEIVCPVGVLASTKENLFYYVYEDMMKEPIVLGEIKRL